MTIFIIREIYELRVKLSLNFIKLFLIYLTNKDGWMEYIRNFFVDGDLNHTRVLALQFFISSE